MAMAKASITGIIIIALSVLSEVNPMIPYEMIMVAMAVTIGTTTPRTLRVATTRIANASSSANPIMSGSSPDAHSVFLKMR